MTEPGKPTTAPRPFLKWPGAKREVWARLRPHFPAPGALNTYVEPFLGGGSVALYVLHELAPRRAVLSDSNGELIEAFLAVRDDLPTLLELTHTLLSSHDTEQYYRVRRAVPDTATERAARLVYLSKTCFNGLYRVNRSGVFNVPIGRHRRAATIDPVHLGSISALLQRAEIVQAPFERALVELGPGDLAYLDPPYDPVSETAYFTAYDRTRFARPEQSRLAARAAELAEAGCRVVASNSDTPFVRSLYPGFDLHEISVLRRISRDGDGRKRLGELVLTAGPMPGAAGSPDAG
jgi:DNA adenine methylase